MRQHVERNGLRKSKHFGFPKIQLLGRLLCQFTQTFASGARNRLVGGHVNSRYAGNGMNGRQGNYHLNGRAVRVGYDAAAIHRIQQVRIDFGHHQRDVVVIAKS